jgi:hypothetical protein
MICYNQRMKKIDITKLAPFAFFGLAIIGTIIHVYNLETFIDPQYHFSCRFPVGWKKYPGEFTRMQYVDSSIKTTAIINVSAVPLAGVPNNESDLTKFAAPEQVFDANNALTIYTKKIALHGKTGYDLATFLPYDEKTGFRTRSVIFVHRGSVITVSLLAKGASRETAETLFDQHSRTFNRLLSSLHFSNSLREKTPYTSGGWLLFMAGLLCVFSLIFFSNNKRDEQTK